MTTTKGLEYNIRQRSQSFTIDRMIEKSHGALFNESLVKLAKSYDLPKAFIRHLGFLHFLHARNP